MTARPTTALALAAALAACGAEPTTPPPPPDRVEPAAAPADDAPAQDTVMGLVQAPGFELVLQNCITCHGPRQFLQQRGDRDTWRGLIRWMQRDHGLRALEDDVEDRIVDYLATNYGPEHGGRRRPLPPDLMPPNPYATK